MNHVCTRPDDCNWTRQAATRRRDFELRRMRKHPFNLCGLHTVAIDCHAKHMFLSLKKDLRVILGIVVADKLLPNARLVSPQIETLVSVTIAVFFFNS